MNGFKASLICAGLLLTAIASAHVHPFGNPRSIPAGQRIGLLRDAQMPDAAKQVLITKCANCHSDATKWPVYSNVAPVSWLVEHDVVEGRAHLNLSHWQELSPDRRQLLAKEIVQQTRHGSMPPLAYRSLHWHARLISADVASLSVLAPDSIEETAAAPGDAGRGKKVFERRCTGCHALDSNREGPHLRGVYGRTAGTVPDFDYSTALKSSKLVWNDQTLERWLRDTDQMIPENKMGISVPKAQERVDIVAYLKTIRE